MGVERQSSFEQEVLRQSGDCQVYGAFCLSTYSISERVLEIVIKINIPFTSGFDFSVSQWGPELRGDAQVNSRAHFFPYKIGAVDHHGADPKEYSLQGIMRELGHEFIDIWKVSSTIASSIIFLGFSDERAGVDRHRRLGVRDAHCDHRVVQGQAASVRADAD